MSFPPVIADMLLDMPRIRSTFVNWIAVECKRLSQKRNKLATHEAFQLKSSGLSRGGLDRTSSDIVHSVAILSCRGVSSSATYYRHIRRDAGHSEVISSS